MAYSNQLRCSITQSYESYRLFYLFFFLVQDPDIQTKLITGMMQTEAGGLFGWDSGLSRRLGQLR